MKILFVLHAPKDEATAVYAYTAARCRHLESRGHRCEIWGQEDLPSRAASRWRPLDFPLAVAARLRREPPRDLVVFHSYAGWAFNLARRTRRPRTVTQFHGLEPLYRRAVQHLLLRSGDSLPWRHLVFQELVVDRLIRSSCRRSDAVLCMNSAEAAFLAEESWADRSRIARVVPPVEEIFFTTERAPAPRFDFVFLGQWLAAKGNRELVSAFTAVVRRHPGATLCCLGTLESEDTVLGDFPAAARRFVTVIPRSSRARVAATLADSRIFVFPSVSEGLGMAVVEAMAVGLPIISAPVGASPDLLGRDDAAFVPASDSRALAAMMVGVLEDPERQRRLGEAARERASTLRGAGPDIHFESILTAVAEESR